MVVVEAQKLEVLWIGLTLLAAYVSKLGASAAGSLRIFFSALDVYMTRRKLLESGNHSTHYSEYLYSNFCYNQETPLYPQLGRVQSI